MSTLLDALNGGNFSVGHKVASEMDDSFANKVGNYRDAVVNDFLRYNTDLNQNIAKIAKSDNLNDDQIQRIIEEVNNQVYLIKYNQMKNSPERDVEFDLAALPKIKNAAKEGERPSKTASYGVGSGSFEKRASWESQDDGDSLNFLNFSGYDTMNLSVDMQTKEQILEKEAKAELEKVENEYKKTIDKFAADIYNLADCMVKYDRFNLDVQELFTFMCKEADFRKYDQCFIKDAITQKVAQLKEYKLVADDYDFNVELVDVDKVNDEFSLGKYSFVKQAKITPSNSNIPTVLTDGGRTIRDLGELVNTAKSAKDNQKKAKELSDKKNSIATKNKK